MPKIATFIRCWRWAGAPVLVVMPTVTVFPACFPGFSDFDFEEDDDFPASCDSFNATTYARH